MPGLGDTFLLPKPGVEEDHLWALITKPDPETGKAIMVNLTTQRPHSDTTAIIQPGEHPFVHQPTVVFYADARTIDISLLETALAQGLPSRSWWSPVIPRSNVCARRWKRSPLSCVGPARTR